MYVERWSLPLQEKSTDMLGFEVSQYAPRPFIGCFHSINFKAARQDLGMYARYVDAE